VDVGSISRFAGRWFAVIVVLAGAVAVVAPAPFVGLAPAVPWLLAVIMLGMGMTLTPSDFVIVGRRPLALLLGVATQFLVMPLLALGIALLLRFPPELAAGMVLVGSAPGGTASNVIVYLSRGDTALSVAMTSVSTLLAPVVTPFLVLLLAGQFLPVDAGDLVVSIVQIVLVPVLVGLVLRRLAPRAIERALPGLPLVSVSAITVVVMAVVAGSADALRDVALLLIVGVMLHNAAGLALGYGVAAVCRVPESSRRAISVEVGMQNSGLAAALATAHFTPVAALPSALFSVWHNVSGAALASFWARRAPEPVTGRRPTVPRT
jgi:bile acid:Na+ symporter, BASS family